MVPGAPPTPQYTFPDALLPALLTVSLSAINLLSPVYGPDGTTIIDFTLDYLNPAAQRMADLPEQPGTTVLMRFPEMATTGVFDFYRRTYTSGAPGTFEVNYQADGIDNYFRLAAQRHQDQLIVSFIDTADQPRSPVEVALREAQAAEKAARADAETQRQRLYQVLMNLPAQVATYHGPEHVYTLVNQRYQDYFPTYTLLGRSVREAVPEAAGQGFFDRLDQVYATGEPIYGQELPVQLDFAGTGHAPELIYINAFYLPLSPLSRLAWVTSCHVVFLDLAAHLPRAGIRHAVLAVAHLFDGGTAGA